MGSLSSIEGSWSQPRAYRKAIFQPQPLERETREGGKTRTVRSPLKYAKSFFRYNLSYPLYNVAQKVQYLKMRPLDVGSEKSDSADHALGLAVTNHKNASDTHLAQDALVSILQSPPFRSSKQCQDLLRYVVEHSLTGEENLLRERVIGATVFGRAPDYDTANDPVVRARMAEVRKRLAQYYQGENQDTSPVRIEIQPGHYKVHFRHLVETSPAYADTRDGVAEKPESAGQVTVLAPALPAPAIAEPRRSLFRPTLLPFWALAAIAAITAVVLSSGAFRPVKQTAFDEFWMPAMKSSMPVMIYTGTNVVYRFSAEFLDKYRRLHHLENTGPEFEVDLKSAGALDASDLNVSNNAYVTTGDVSACTAIASMLVQHGKPYELRFAGDISPGDLHSDPIVLIGAFNNAWTLNVTNPLRFTFAEGDKIRDRYDKNRSWAVSVKPNGVTTDDYAIVSRLLSADRGEAIMTAAGIGEYGTEAASEFLASPQKINAFAQNAPAGWSRKNLQIVMHVKVVDEAPSSEEIVATYYW